MLLRLFPGLRSVLEAVTCLESPRAMRGVLICGLSLNMTKQALSFLQDWASQKDSGYQLDKVARGDRVLQSHGHVPTGHATEVGKRSCSGEDG